jgi:hypothetical protein
MKEAWRNGKFLFLVQIWSMVGTAAATLIFERALPDYQRLELRRIADKPDGRRVIVVNHLADFHPRAQQRDLGSFLACPGGSRGWLASSSPRAPHRSNCQTEYTSCDEGRKRNRDNAIACAT